MDVEKRTAESVGEEAQGEASGAGTVDGRGGARNVRRIGVGNVDVFRRRELYRITGWDDKNEIRVREGYRTSKKRRIGLRFRV